MKRTSKVIERRLLIDLKSKSKRRRRRFIRKNKIQSKISSYFTI